MPVEKDSEVYNMNNKKRGIALIFNHMNFEPRLGLKARSGTDADCSNLIRTFEKLQLEVKAFKDLTFKEIVSWKINLKKIKKSATQIFCFIKIEWRIGKCEHEEPFWQWLPHSHCFKSWWAWNPLCLWPRLQTGEPLDTLYSRQMSNLGWETETFFHPGMPGKERLFL